MALRPYFKITIFSCLLFVFSSCQKTVEKSIPENPVTAQPAIQNANTSSTSLNEEPQGNLEIARVKHNNNNEKGNFEWYLEFDNGRWEVPTKLHEPFYKEDLLVQVMYNYTNKTIIDPTSRMEKRMIEITYITVYRAPSN